MVSTQPDFFYFNEPLDDDVLKRLKKELDREKLNAYLKRYSKRFAENVFKNLSYKL